jgi:hypothetical protein
MRSISRTRQTKISTFSALLVLALNCGGCSVSAESSNKLGAADTQKAVASAKPLALPSALPTADLNGIPDNEPNVTEDLRLLVQNIIDNRVSPDAFTAKAQAAVFPTALQQMRAAMQSLGSLKQMQLLARAVDGEDRHYRYRLKFEGGVMLLAMSYNKGGKVDRLSITQAN